MKTLVQFFLNYEKTPVPDLEQEFLLGSGVIADQDTLIGQLGNLGDLCTVDIDLHQKMAGGQSIHGSDVSIVIHQYIVQVFKTGQIVQTIQQVIGAVNGHQRAILFPFGKDSYSIIGEVQLLKRVQRTELADINEGVVGNIQIRKVLAFCQLDDIGQRIAAGGEISQVGQVIHSAKCRDQIVTDIQPA